MRHFIDVILPLPIPKTYTYEVSEREAAFLSPGFRVAVPFGKAKIYTGLVRSVHQDPPQHYDAKEIDQILDEVALVKEVQLKHWEWIASYYMCSVGEVFRAAVPPSFLLESETMVIRDETFDDSEETLKDDEWLVFEALQHQSVLNVQEIAGITDRKRVLPIIKRLLAKGVIQIREEVKEQYKPKMIRYVKLHENYSTDEALNQLLEELSRAPRQRDVIMSLFTLEVSDPKPVKVKTLQERSGASSAVIKSLIEKNILQAYLLQHDRVGYEEGELDQTKELNEYQQEALLQISSEFKSKDVVLLHGVTSSGKTEVYVKLIAEVLAREEQVLYLLPEIALTTQLIRRLREYFGEKVLVYHSKYSANERVEVWNKIAANEGGAQVVIGARSALLLPYESLGLIIIDEEHETSFKQYDPAPRYHARDAAIVLGKLHHARVLLGSATPSMESYYNAQTGKYGLVNITRRYGNVLMPDMELVDIKDKLKKRRMNGHFSDRLMEEIQESLSEGEQVILFQNRRGYAPVLECNTCGHSPGCPNCDVTLTYHQFKDQLRCHYCGYRMARQLKCLACGSDELDTKGFGTEQIEEEVKVLFPKASVGRMDSDTTRGKYGYDKIISAFEQQELDILVGTQMVTKGLDFRNVSLVGVMQADTMLNFPDFRAHERSFQMIQQVAGRAGRTLKRGKVIIQTYNPFHQILQQASMNRFETMFSEQMEERRQFRYPPFYRLIKITFRHKDYNKVNESSEWYAKYVRNVLRVDAAMEVLGPEFPAIPRVRNSYNKNLVIKIPADRSVGLVKQQLKKIDNSFNAIANFRSVRVIYDVDNY
ncbi:replication restart helicase PriA [Robertkochia solimangrovi]|uniref:replication restart helicase PriA n=1 Tax=Robertkochia solimangrovi TaxID=2213046 RepID=UPI00117CF535|nr:primosomal protein N' [Robertkochia solimangrovi]TRZ43634.1 primosomal protein N' [Robertkochia solimangrovi]